MAKKIEEQKGSIHAGEKTSHMMTHAEKVQEAREQAALRRSGQTLTRHEPKSGRK